MSNTILVLSGPNLNLLGEREPEVYGKETLDDHVATARDAAVAAGYQVEHLQSNHEGELIDAIHGARGRTAAIVFNPGAFTHYAHALADALAAYDGVVVEVHLSNPSAREAWRRTSVIAPVATGTVAGFGGTGYRLAVEAAIAMIPGGPGASTETPGGPGVSTRNPGGPGVSTETPGGPGVSTEEEEHA